MTIVNDAFFDKIYASSEPVVPPLVLSHSAVATFLGDMKNSFGHYGVPGMKWGQRKRKGGKRTGSGSPSSSHRKALSDDELRTRIARIKMEREFFQLTNAQEKKANSFLTDLFVGSAKTASKTIVTKGLTDVGNMAVEKLIKEIAKKR